MAPALLRCLAHAHVARAVAHAQRVHDVADAAHAPGDVLGAALLAARGDRACEGDLGAVYVHFDVAGIDDVVVGQPLADFLEQARVGRPVARAEAAVVGDVVVAPPGTAPAAVARVVAAEIRHVASWSAGVPPALMEVRTATGGP